MRYVSVCSGIEAASVAWHPLGWECAAVSEIEAFPSAVLAHHYPGVPNLGDLTRYADWPDLGPVDLLVGGTPCQSFSVAGLRQGLADPRGNLALVFLGLLDRLRPRWVVWENVPGVLSSSGGRDFGSFLGGLAELGYGWAYRVLDAQYFGVAQRRRRVFVVGYLGDWRPPVAVLFESESLRGDTPPRREAGERVAPTVSGGAPFGRTGNERVEADAMVPMGFETGPGGGRFTDLAPTMDARAKDGPIRNQLGVGVMAFDTQKITSKANRTRVAPGLPASTLNAAGQMHVAEIVGAMEHQAHGGVSTQAALSGYIQPMVTHTLRGTGHDASEDGTGRGTPLVAFPLDLRNAGRDPEKHDAQNRQGVGTGEDGDPSPTLSQAFVPGVAAFGWQNSASQGDSFSEHITPSLDKSKVPAVHESAMQVRRLTPTECARLQGFPDDYLNIIYRGKPAADGPKYKALGNSMAVPVMAWIGQRIAMVDGLTKDAP